MRTLIAHLDENTTSICQVLPLPGITKSKLFFQLVYSS